VRRTSDATYRVIVIGAGFSGICLAIKLQEAGIQDYVILEKADEVGGTWRENTYPGAECDVPSALYSYSFEHNAKWRFKWSDQPQILDYQKHVAAKHGLYSHIRFSREVSAAEFDESRHRWTVTTATGETYTGQHLVTAVGQLHRPSTPTFPDDEAYTGIRFHSARWDHTVDLKGKRVGVIGNAASALQFIPEIAEDAAHVTVFQRSANWVVPKQDRPYRPWEQWISDRIPLIARLYRLRIWLRGELLILPAMRKNKLAQAALRRLSRRSLEQHITDPELVRKLTPDYPIGAKRLLFSDNYYEALARDNVHLDTSGIERFTPTGILRKDGVEEAFDVIIYGTGFKTNPFLAPMDIHGLRGRSIRDAWASGAQAYLGVSTHGFPNLHMMYGPNTNLGHNSIIVMIEAQTRYIIECIKGIEERGSAALDVKEDVETRYNEEIQERLHTLAFYDVASSWYMDAGRVTNNWAGSTWEYMRRLRNVPWEAYDLLGSIDDRPSTSAG
jgi:cation diffusion facilitator CzcD-associated flavoprotein CzcO